MSNQDKDRGTGRTQRGVVQAVSAMLMGKNVVHVSGSSDAAMSALAYARIWLHDNGWCDQSRVDLTVNNATMVIRFGSGKLQFHSMHGALPRGLPTLTVFKDHYVLECEAVVEDKKARTEAKEQITKLMDQFGWECVQPNRQYTDGRREFWLGRETKDEA